MNTLKYTSLVTMFWEVILNKFMKSLIASCTIGSSFNCFLLATLSLEYSSGLPSSKYGFEGKASRFGLKMKAISGFWMIFGSISGSAEPIPGIPAAKSVCSLVGDAKIFMVRYGN